MAFQYLGEITGGLAPVVKRTVAANCYQGQMLGYDMATSGQVIPVTAASDDPDDTNVIAGICLGQWRNTSPGTSLYDATYKGDLVTYDTSQANLLLNDPPGPALAAVQILTPNSLIWAPIVKDTVGTAPECKAATTAVSNGLTFVIAAIDTTVSLYSTAYCRTGANRGQYRRITTGAVATQTVVIPFQKAIAIGDTFCVVNVVEGFAHIDFDTQFQGIDSSPALTAWYNVIVHELNLEEAGKEYCTFRFAPLHFTLHTI